LLSTIHRKQLEDVEQGISKLMGIVSHVIQNTGVNDPNFLKIYPKFLEQSKLRNSLLKANFSVELQQQHNIHLKMANLSKEVNPQLTTHILTFLFMM
jgi:hypothetical protein